MRLVLTACLSLFVVGNAGAQDTSPPDKRMAALAHYVEYGNIRFHDEKAMLDHYASQFRLAPDNIIYITAYSGREACVGEAKARALRAKNYLVKRHGIAPDRVVWKDGGLRESLSVELWLRPRAETPPMPSPTVDPSEATLKDCRPLKRRRRGSSIGRA